MGNRLKPCGIERLTMRRLFSMYGDSLHTCFHLVDPASSHMLVSKIKPCMSEFKLIFGETANGSLYQL